MNWRQIYYFKKKKVGFFKRKKKLYRMPTIFGKLMVKEKDSDNITVGCFFIDIGKEILDSSEEINFDPNFRFQYPKYIKICKFGGLKRFYIVIFNLKIDV